MMFSNFSGQRFYLCRQTTDMRKNFDGLSGMVISALGANPLSGDMFFFTSKRRDRIKLLLWDRDVFWIFDKRLEKGMFQLPGIDLNSVKLRPRYILKIGMCC